MIVVRDDTSAPWYRIGESDDPSQTERTVDISDEASSTANAGTKRPRSPSRSSDPHAPESKRARGDEPSAAAAAGPSRPVLCLAPPVNPIAEKIYQNMNDTSLAAGDVFLTDGWRERWCRCDSVSHLAIIGAPLLILSFLPTYISVSSHSNRDLTS